MNGSTAITNSATKLKIDRVFDDNVFPRFSILNPAFTFTLPRYKMVAGFYDIMCHILEQYFSGTVDSNSDYRMEGLLKSLIRSMRIAVVDPIDYGAHSTLIWIAAWALNTLVKIGKSTNWMVPTDATHDMTFTAVSLP